MPRFSWMIGCCALAACLADAPATQVGELEPVCEGTAAGRACVTLVPSATESVIDELSDETEGEIAWALYEDGEVGTLGPDNRDDYVISGEHVIDLEDEPRTGAVTIVDFQPGWYQVMAYFRPLPVEEPAPGDALTLPTAGFEAPADAHTRVDVVLDAIR